MRWLPNSSPNKLVQMVQFVWLLWRLTLQATHAVQ